MEKHYPSLYVNLEAMRTNAECMCELLGRYGIKAAGVIKFSDANPEVAKAYSCCAQLAVSRAVHLKRLKELLPEKETLLTRPPVKSEMEDVSRYADYVLMSEANGLRALNAAAEKTGGRPGVILMLDVGDRREGVVSIADLEDLALLVENELSYIRLKGVGTNVACLNGVLPTPENMGFLARGAEAVEKAIGRPLEIVSGGSTINLRLLVDGNQMPAKINHLRLGGIIANPMNMRLNRGIHFEGTREDTLRLDAEIVELKEKDSAVVGGTLNWAGKHIETEDRGIRLRAILAVGSQDIGDASNLMPLQEGVSVIGCSSDHTILDVGDYDGPLEVGDVLSFRLRYAGMLQAFSTRHIEIRFEE